MLHSTPASLLLFSLLIPRMVDAQSTSPRADRDSTAQPVTPVSRCSAAPDGQPLSSPPDTAEAIGPRGEGSVSNCVSTMAAMAGAQAQMSPAQMAQLQTMMNPLQMARLKGPMSLDLAARMKTLMSLSPAQMEQLHGWMSPELLAQMNPAQMKQMEGGQPPSDEGPVAASAVSPLADGPGMAMHGMAGTMRKPGRKNIEVSSGLRRDLKNGKTVVRNIDWTPGTGAVTPEGSQGFDRAMAQVAAAMKQAGGSYRVDLYMDQQSGNVVVRTLGPRRLATVRASLVKGAAAPQIGKAQKDGNPRLEIVRLK